jgi:signal peptidase I
MGTQSRSSPRKLRREAKDFLKESRRLIRRGGKRLEKKDLSQLEEAAAALEAAIDQRDSAERLSAALKRLDNLVEKHLGFLRRKPGVAFTISIAQALAVALVLRLFVIEAYKIPSGSMIPSLLVGDRIFVNKLSYGVRLPVVNYDLFHWGGYKRGEIIVFVNPNDDHLPLLERRDFIKRIVGLPGDLVEVKDEVVIVNGVPQPRVLAQERFPFQDRLGDDGPWVSLAGELWKEQLLDADGVHSLEHNVIRDPYRPHASYEGPFKVPPGHLFMMGDNRDNSADGRAGGWYVPFDHVKGRALFIWLSWGQPGTWLWGQEGIRFDRFFQAVH